MKNIIFSFLLATIFFCGCSRETRDDARELGQDIGRDVERGVQDVNRAIQDLGD
ncbi:MAG: hypothetical protein NUV91_05335 [Candidatus Omnitrophica bacterium]|nr:hypothetical protein [Candidatus Omnitrophota bacterium]